MVRQSRVDQAQNSLTRSFTPSRLILLGLLTFFAFSGAMRLNFIFAQEPPPPPVLTTILVTPDPAKVNIGSPQQFSAQGLDQFGNPIGISPVWTATGAPSMPPVFTPPGPSQVPLPSPPLMRRSAARRR